jgi:3-oxoadipate enol-lactonase
MPFVLRDKTRVHYVLHDSGQGLPWLVLIPGLASNSRSFPELVERLSSSFRLLVPDPRGAGETEIQSLRFTLPDVADDIAAAMTDASIDKAFVMGISMGGMIAQELVLRHAHRVSRLMLSVTTCGPPTGVQPSKRTIAALVRGIVRAPRAKSFDDVVRLFGDLLFAPSFPFEKRRAFFEMRRDARPAPPIKTIAQLLAIRQFGSHSRLGTIKTPTLVMSALHDRLMPPINSDILYAAIPGSRIIKFDAGHCSFYEVVEEFAASAESFCFNDV